MTVFVNIASISCSLSLYEYSKVYPSGKYETTIEYRGEQKFPSDQLITQRS